jgi:hypothetical protein
MLSFVSSSPRSFLQRWFVFLFDKMFISLKSDKVVIGLTLEIDDVVKWSEKKFGIHGEELLLTWLKEVCKCSPKIEIVHRQWPNFDFSLSFGRVFTSIDILTGHQSGASLLKEKAFFYNTIIIPSTHKSSFSPNQGFVECFQLRNFVYCSTCLDASSLFRRGSVVPLSYVNGSTSILRRHLNSCSQQNIIEKPKISQESYNKIVCLFLVKNNLSFRLVDDPVFRQILLSPTIPHRTTISTTILSSLYNDFITAFKEMMLKGIHISFDLWTSIAMHHYVLITCQWIDSVEWTLQRACLSIVHLENQDALTIVNSIRDTFLRLSIDEKHVFTLCTDGASNETAAATFQGFCPKAEHIWCFVHKLNLCIGDGFEGRCRARKGRGENETEEANEQNDFEVRKFGRSSQNQFWKSVENGEVLHYERDKMKAQRTVKKLCDEILETVPLFNDDNDDVVDDLKENKKEILVLKELPKTALEVWKFVRIIIGKFRKSHKYRNMLRIACEQVNVPFRTLLLYSTTRWIGSFYEVDSFIELQQPLIFLCENDLKDILVLPTLFFPVVQELRDVLEVMAYPIIELQANQPLVTKQILYARLIDKNLAEMEDKVQCAIVLKFLTVLRESFQFRFSILIHEYDEENPDIVPFVAAMMFDPSLCALWEENYEKSVSAMVTYCCSLYEMFSSSLDMENLLQNQQKYRKRKRDNDKDDDISKKKTRLSIAPKFTLHSLLSTPYNTSQNSQSNNDIDFVKELTLEVKRYARFIAYEMEPRDSNECPLKFWKQVGQHSFPVLAVLALIVLGQPIGTVETERECSNSGNIITKARNRLGDQKIDKLLMIHKNANEDWAKKRVTILTVCFFFFEF